MDDFEKEKKNYGPWSIDYGQKDKHSNGAVLINK